MPFEEEKLLKLKQHELARHLSHVMTTTFHGAGKWKDVEIHRVLMTLIRQRPRDLVKLCSAAARRSNERSSSSITTVDFNDVLENYSADRIQDAINEHVLELPDIERLILSMKPNKKTASSIESYLFKSDRLLEKLKNIISSGSFRYATNKIANPKDLADFLYKIDFLIARKDFAQGIDRKYFEQSRYLSSS